MTDTLPRPDLDELEAGMKPGAVIVVSAQQGRFTQVMSDGRHRVVADEPASVGGDDKGPGPYELLLMSLGACTSMTLKMYAERKKWPLADVLVSLKHEKAHASDCADCPEKDVMIDHIARVITLVGPLDGGQRTRLLEIADKCPVHRTLSSTIAITTHLQPG